MIDGYDMMKEAGGGLGGGRSAPESLKNTLETFLQNATKSQKPRKAKRQH